MHVCLLWTKTEGMNFFFKSPFGTLYVCENVHYGTRTHKCVWEDVLRGFARIYIGILNYLVQLHKKFPDSAVILFQNSALARKEKTSTRKSIYIFIGSMTQNVALYELL